MKRVIIVLAALLSAQQALPAQQDVTPISGVQSSIGALKSQVNTRLDVAQDNFTDLYTNKAATSCFGSSSAWAACFPGLPLVGSNLSLSDINTYIEDNATPVTPEEIGALWNGDGYMLTDGTAIVAPPGIVFLTADPASPSNNSAWYNTTSNELRIATAAGLWTDGTFAAWSPVDAFQLTSLTDQTADGLLKCSAAIIPTGANHSWPVTVSGDAGCSVKINGGSAAATGTYTPGDTVEACVNTSASASTTTSCTPSIGAVEATQAFSVTTAAGAVEYTRAPTGSGVLKNWTATGAVTPWEAVDDAVGVPDDSTTYIYKSTTGASESFTYPVFNVPAGTTIASVKVHARCKNSLTGTTGVRARIYVNGTLYTSAYDPDVTNSYTEYISTWSTNPNTSAQWTVDSVNGTGASPLQDFAIEARGLTDGEQVECTQVYIEVVPQ